MLFYGETERREREREERDKIGREFDRPDGQTEPYVVMIGHLACPK